MLMQKGLAAVSGRMPKVINPRTHAVIDYVVAGTFLAVGALYWGRNKRAAISSFICGAATVINSMLTDYPGGTWRIMSYRNHGRIDAGLAGITATMPNLMQFADDREARFFQMQALAETTVTALTDFEAYDVLPHSRDWHEAA
jgi:hypothetical protein